MGPFCHFWGLHSMFIALKTGMLKTIIECVHILWWLLVSDLEVTEFNFFFKLALPSRAEYRICVCVCVHVCVSVCVCFDYSERICKFWYLLASILTTYYNYLPIGNFLIFFYFKILYVL
jgi:hypothetical protein